MSRRVRWFSCGAASAVATKLDLVANPGGIVVYCDTRSEHEDNARFLADCERWFGQEVIRASSDRYADHFDVWQRERYISGVEGAKCAGELKAAPRIAMQRPDDIHVFGYTSDRSDVKRAENFKKNWFELTVETPLIDRDLNKAACLAMLIGAGIKLPVMYELGFHNNNCIPCGKATSPAYWALIRKCFPDRFARTAAISRELGAKLVIVGQEKGPDGKRVNIRAFIDEIPADQPVTNPIAPACDFLCHIAEQDLVRE